MRILLLLLFSLSFSTGIFAQAPKSASQLENNSTLIGVSSKLDGAAKLYFIPGEDKQLYILTFYNPDSPNMYEVENLSFYATPKDLEKLYNFLKEGFSSKERSVTQIGDGQTIGVSFAYSSILVEVIREKGLNGWFFLSKKQLDRLFGKI